MRKRKGKALIRSADESEIAVRSGRAGEREPDFRGGIVTFSPASGVGASGGRTWGEWRESDEME